MTDDWLKKAEAQRQQHQHETGASDAEREAGAKAFYEENKGQVAAILTEVGELWKSMDPHKTVLGMTTHVGHNFRVEVNKFGSASGIGLYLFDQTHKASIHSTSNVRVLIENSGFTVFMTNGPLDEWINRNAQTLEELKAVLGELWAAGKIKA